MYIMPSTPLTCASIGAATVSCTVFAFAPGYRAVTVTVGGVTSGYCATGSVNAATGRAEEAGNEPLHRGDREEPSLADALDDREKHRRQEDAAQRHAEHAAEDRRPQRAAHLRAGARRKAERHDSKDERERRHQD